MDYKKYIRSNEWLSVRIDILTNRNKCERCGSKRKLQVHHLTYVRLGNEEPSDLEVLCCKCHMNEHNLLKVKKTKVKKQLTLAQKVDKKKRKQLEKAKRKKRLKKKYGY